MLILKHIFLFCCLGTIGFGFTRYSECFLKTQKSPAALGSVDGMFNEKKTAGIGDSLVT